MIKTAQLQYLLTISRPRFYSYVFGPFIVGLAIGVQDLAQLSNPVFLNVLLFFLVPANLFLYGINDLFDEETDAFNQKKGSKEHLLKKSERSLLILVLAVVCALSLLIMVQLPLYAKAFLGLFMFLSTGYSAPPLRFKARPFLDAYSNILYAVPGFLAYSLVTGSLPSVMVVLLAWAWTAGMHTLSAVPDIIPDKKAGIRTTAVVLGERKALWFVLLNWVVFSAISIWVLSLPVGLISIVYPATAVWLLNNPRSLVAAYWWFPLINTLVGGVAFWYFFLPLL